MLDMLDMKTSHDQFSHTSKKNSHMGTSLTRWAFLLRTWNWWNPSSRMLQLWSLSYRPARSARALFMSLRVVIVLSRTHQLHRPARQQTTLLPLFTPMLIAIFLT